MTALRPIAFHDGSDKEQVEREVIERHRAACNHCGWRGEWHETTLYGSHVNGADIQAVTDLGRHLAETHATIVMESPANV